MCDAAPKRRKSIDLRQQMFEHIEVFADAGKDTHRPATLGITVAAGFQGFVRALQ